MYRFLLRPKWLLFHLAVLVLVVVMINLALWQVRRLHQRQDFNAEVRAHAEAPARPVADVLPPETEIDPSALQWYDVTASGTYRAADQVLVVNLSQNGIAGVDAVLPLELPDGRLLLVNRGFVPDYETVPAPPSGEVTIRGRLRPSQKRATGALSDPEEGVLREVQRLDIGRLQQQIDGEVLPMYVDLLDSDPAEPEHVTPVADPELTDGPHLSYAIQWSAFSVGAIVAWVLAVRRSIRTRTRAAATPAAAD